MVGGAAGLPWQQALAAVFISGLVLLLLSLTGVRAWLVSGIPASLRSAIVAGIGLFLAIIALQKSGVIIANEDTLVALGPLNTAPPLLALAGFLLIAILEARRVRGAILIGILAVTAAGWALGDLQYHGLVSLPPSLAPTFLQLDLPGLLKLPGAQKRFGRALMADSTAIVAGSLLGTSSATAFAESASGVQVGAAPA
ncbi:MAG: Adenine permease AdeP [Stenotrophomonas maltophilia]|uniref:Adenine permease AdeP n=1 Tax=Stenotrophomonas maltophilia TaxID=40324 RepID=A0A7V8JKY7_STEMA|nr:MAG: Adenine permease AdeP [Stenotrophomonas maltophilia]